MEGEKWPRGNSVLWLLSQKKGVRGTMVIDWKLTAWFSLVGFSFGIHSRVFSLLHDLMVLLLVGFFF
jgi:hypothetical protein